MIKTFALIALPLMTLAAPAFAQSDTASVTVSYRDLDLATPAGAAALHQRIAAAADRVAGEPDNRDAGVRMAAQHNRAVAMAAAEAQMQTAVAAAQSATRFASATPNSTASGS